MKSKKIVVECHKHVDDKGFKFGASHPIEAVHKNVKTQERHDKTIIYYAVQDI